MREIKFRGQRKDNKEWVYGSLLLSWHMAWIKNKDDITTNPRLICQEYADFRCLEVIPETVGQFTGILDKNGKEVYEGDIVKAVETWSEIEIKEYVFSVEWDRCCAILKRTNPKQIFDFLEFMDDEDCIPTTIEVIGNIHDNPELVKE